MYLLDTNIISEIRKIQQGKGDAGVQNWIKQVHSESVFTNVVVLMELERGIVSMKRRDPVQGERLRVWYESVVMPTFAGRILPVDKATAHICARLHVPNRIPSEDAWIAASAIQHDLILATRNINDFCNLDVKLFNPFSTQDQGQA